MRDLPSGTVTFLFTDIEGSTRLLHELGEESYADALAEHRRLVRDACHAHGGVEVDTQGDAFFVVFPDTTGAVAASQLAQAALAAGPIQVRMGLHTGTARLTAEGYVGSDVHLGARIATAGHGGQVLLSRSVRERVDGDICDLGEHRLKDFDEPIQIFQLGADGFPPLRTISNTNLPHPASVFVGRQREIDEVMSLLRGDARLVTLTGPGGSGKTRLAIESAAELVPEFKSGVFWVGLAALRDSALVMDTVAQTLGAKQELAGHIGEREMLLLLDNVEQVIEVAPEIAALAEACPNLRLLVTSRELLRLQGEVEYPVPPLAAAEAEELFCARSRLAPDATIAELCRRLDDLPLAVELAAARTAVLSPAQIRDRLSQRLDLFKGGRDVDARQQTLRATIEWSYELLSSPERQLFARLSAFAGGCTLDAAEEVVGADLDGLQSLVDKSLVRMTDGRFWMLETIRELGRERFQASHDAAAIGRRHADYFLALAERAEPALKGADQPAWLQRLEDDHDNLRGGLDWFLEHHQAENAMRLAGALSLFWYTHGHVNEARRWLRRTLDAGPEEPSEARSTVLDAAGHLAHDQGDDEEAIGLLETSLSYAKEVGATSSAASAAAHLCATRKGFDPQAALAEGEEAVALAREAEDDWVLSVALNNLGDITRLLGETARATAYHEESLELRRRLGDRSRIALSLGNVAEMTLLGGDLDRATVLFAEAADAASAIGDKRHVCFALNGLAWVAYLQRRWEEADAHARDSLRLSTELGMKVLMVEELSCLAGIAAATGDVERAARLAAAAELHNSLLATEPTLADAGFHKSDIESARAACDPETWERASVKGRAMSLDQAAEHALSYA